MTQYQDRIGNIVKIMHVYGIKQSDAANKVGISREYLNRVLNYKEHNEAIISDIESALKDIIAERS